MKIGILTHPIHNNYGGALQAFALHYVLSQKGHNVCLIRREWNLCENLSLYRKIVFEIKSFIKFIIGYSTPTSLSAKDQLIIEKVFSDFVSQYIQPSTPKIYNTKSLKAQTSNFDCIVIGSDQVWRPSYTPNIMNFFMDFCCKNDKILKFSYASSFGVDMWEFDAKQTSEIKFYLSKFKGISVRESTGVELCKSKLGLKARHVADPTLLLFKEDYIKIFSLIKPTRSSGHYLFTYILDPNNCKLDAQKKISSILSLSTLNILPDVELTTENIRKCPEKCAYKPVEAWLQSFLNADYILTDSFHGVVFSIIFNKPFWAILNKKRGNSRFESLLKKFNLESRIISDEAQITANFLKLPIDWVSVNTIHSNFREESLTYLDSMLSMN